jgi:hypothetical protein
MEELPGRRLEEQHTEAVLRLQALIRADLTKEGLLTMAFVPSLLSRVWAGIRLQILCDREKSHELPNLAPPFRKRRLSSSPALPWDSSVCPHGLLMQSCTHSLLGCHCSCFSTGEAPQECIQDRELLCFAIWVGLSVATWLGREWLMLHFLGPMSWLVLHGLASFHSVTVFPPLISYLSLLPKPALVIASL